MKLHPSVELLGSIRPLTLGIVAVLAALIALAVTMGRHRPQPQPVLSTSASATTAPSNSAPTARNVAPDHRPARLGTSTMEPETARLVSVMLDPSAALEVRRQAARSLDKIGTAEAMAAIKSALAGDNPPYLKVAIAEGLGECPNPEARDLLLELVNGKDQTIARGAARGIAARGDADAVDTLGKLLFNDQTPLSVRTESALALGDVPLPTAQSLLASAVAQIHDEDILESALDGLGRRPFADTQEFFGNYLNSPDVPPAAKVLAIESLRDAEGDVTPFLARYVNDPNPDVRAAAKAALQFLNPTPRPTPPSAQP